MYLSSVIGYSEKDWRCFSPSIRRSKIPASNNQCLYHELATLLLIFVRGKPASGDAFEKDTVISLREKLRNWLASYKCDTTRHRWEKMEEALSSLTTPDKITTCDKR